MKNDRPQAKDIHDDAILAVIDKVRVEEGRWTHRWDFDAEIAFPAAVILAKCASMIRRGLITGCTCGCRGDFERTAGNP